MTRLLDKLNLSPQERRLVLFVAVVVFVALNWFLVRPYFGELGRSQQKIKDTDAKLKEFSDEIQRKPMYEKQKALLSQQGNQVATEEQATSLIREVGNQAGVAGVSVQSLIPATRSRDNTRTNFFEEQGANLTFMNTGEQELINFLYGLASQQSLIRVKSMTLHPDQGRMKLGGTITLVESFQKKKTAKAAVAAPTPSAPKSTAPPQKTTSPPPKTASPPPKTAAPTKTPLPGSLPSKTNTPPKKTK